MKFVPEPYQELGIDFLTDESIKAKALLAGMGLGKTAMTLGAADHLFKDGAMKGLLVVAPIRVINMTWPNELALWDEFNWMEYANLRTKEGQQKFRDGDAHIYAINYEMLPAFCQQFLDNKKARDLPFDTIVYDELSKAKNHASVRIKHVRRHWAKIERHWGLTGTPSPNSKLDLFAQYRLLDNGERLGGDYNKFRSQHFYAVDRDQTEWLVMKGQENVIESKLSDMTLVLRSADWLNIPDTEVINIDITLPPEARAQYKKLAKELILLIDHHEINAVNAAVLVNKLTQITSGAVYSAQQEIPQPDGSIKIIPSETVVLHDEKIKALKQIYKEQKGEPLMVAYLYRHEEERLRKAFPDAVCFSDYKTAARQDAIAEAWNNKMIPMLIVSPQSAGHGLNLQHGGADICWFSPTWSRELYDQLNARVARKGQTNISRVFRLLATKTMDEAVAEALRQKGADQSALMDAIMNFKILNQST